MSGFVLFGRWRSPGGVGEPGGRPGDELPEAVRRAVPPGFEAVAEALMSASDTTPACAVVGRVVARDGAALGEALDGLRTAFELVLGGEPDFASVQALAMAWSEATLELLHDVSCEDPLTGLASRAHLRTRVEEIYREAGRLGGSVARSHAVVVVEVGTPGPPAAGHQLTRALRLVQVAECARAVFAGEETVARVRTDRALLVVRRTGSLGSRVAALRDLLADVDLGPRGARLWIEGLPERVSAAARMLDELAR
jgi:GGDEF domain-containing protein